jgi:hypothetical protein
VDKISIISLISVSIPEAIIVAVLGILAIGKFSFFKNKSNFIKILFLSVISAFFQFFIRRNVNTEMESLTIFSIIIVLLYIFLLRLNVYESITAALFGSLILAVTELILLTAVTAIPGINLAVALKNDLHRFLIVLPERIVQVFMAYFAYRYKIKIVDFDSATMKKKAFYIQFTVYVISIISLIFFSAVMAKEVLFNDGAFGSPTYSLLLRLNIYITIFITIILTISIKSIHEYHKNRAKLNNTEHLQSLTYISNLIDQNNYSDAKETIENLKLYISKL